MIIKQILFKNQRKLPLLFALLGSLIGLFTLLLSIHYFIQINTYGKKSGLFGENTFILQKKISTLSTLGLATSDFSLKDIASLKKNPLITDVQIITNNQFDVSIQTDSKLVPYFRSDIFLQSVDAKFLQKTTADWNWNENEEDVPLILPRSFMVMLNTFTHAKGLPPISEGIAQSIRFKLTISNGKKKQSFNAKIVGFTSKIPSIIVPPSFMHFGNKHFPNQASKKTTQLIVTIKKGKIGEFENFMKSHDLTVSTSHFLIGKLKRTAQILFSILFGISTIIVLLSGLISVQYVQSIIVTHQKSIQKLLHLGYYPSTLVRQLMRQISLYFLATAVLSILLFIGGKFLIDRYFIENGIQIATSYSFWSFFVFFFVILLLISSNFITIQQKIGHFK